jgi:hypothetical protein
MVADQGAGPKQPDTWAKAWSRGVVRAREEDGWSPVEARDFLVSHGLPRLIIFE